MDYAAIGKRIRAHRKRLNLSQEELAEMVNISTVHMSHIETGYTKLSLPVLVDLACALGVRTDDLIFDKDALGKTELLEEIRIALMPSFLPCDKFYPAPKMPFPNIYSRLHF